MIQVHSALTRSTNWGPLAAGANGKRLLWAHQDDTGTNATSRQNALDRTRTAIRDIPESQKTDCSQKQQEQRVLVVGTSITGLLLAKLLSETGFAVTVVPSASPGMGGIEPGAALRKPTPPKRIDSNQLGISVVFESDERAYYDLIVDSTGDRRFLADQDRRRVAVLTPIRQGNLKDTVRALAILSTLVDALATSQSVSSALEQYRRCRDRILS